MFGSVYSKSMWVSRKSIIIWALSMAALMLMMVLMFPSIGESGGYAAIANEMPDAMKAFVGEFGNVSTPEGFLGVEMYSMMVPVMLLVLAVGQGSGAIGKEEDSGTLELLLASPLSRTKILFQKALAMITNVIIVGMSAVVGIYIGKLFVEFDIDFSKIFWATAVASMLAIVFGLISLLITAFGGGRGTAIGVSAGIFIVSYFLNTLPSVITWLEPYQRFSINKYGDAQATLLHGANFSYVLVLLALALVIYLLANPLFSRRDTGV